MRFWDTSAIVPLIADESMSGHMRSEYGGDANMVVWWATRVECLSAIARCERVGESTREQAAEAFDRLAELRGDWDEIDPVERIRQTAERLLRVHPLRAADALQLAAAIVASEGDPSTLSFVTLDGRLAEAARREGFPVVTF